jgi:thioredoxin
MTGIAAVCYPKNDEQAQKIIESSPGLVVVDFFAEWCHPCKLVGPDFERLAAEYLAADSAITFVKIDCDEMEETAEKFGIEAMPTFKFFKEGKEVSTYVGVKIESVREIIESAK